MQVILKNIHAYTYGREVMYLKESKKGIWKNLE